jgi:peptidase E
MPNTPPQQIVAMGGGGFMMEPENLLLDRYILGLTGKERPKVLFVPTATGDSQERIDTFYRIYGDLDCEPGHLSLFRHRTIHIRELVLGQDVIYVSGGNTRNMLVLWETWGLDTLLREAWERGIVLAGLSAGSICWFEEGVTDSIPAAIPDMPGDLAAMRCLGFLPGSNCPHYDGEEARRPAYHLMIGRGLISPGYAADDGVGLHYIGTELSRAVSSRPRAKGYRVERNGDVVSETVLETTYLGAGTDVV